MVDVKEIRQLFPAFSGNGTDKPLVFLDNASTTQKPASVIDAIMDYYQSYCSNVHRGIYPIGYRATKAYENSRKKVTDFINARSSKEIIFTKGTTEGVNLIVQSYLLTRLKEGDEVIISAMEHHSNLVPWQMACQKKKASLKIIPINKKGELQLEKLVDLVSPRTAMIALVHISNSLGTINNIHEVAALANSLNIPFLVDAAQSIAIHQVDVQKIGCTFLVGSGHKMYGPTGIGFLYGKETVLEKMEPYQFGGEMIRSVDFEKTTFADLPNKFEGGTPNVAGAIGLGAAIDFINSLDMEKMNAHLDQLLEYGTSVLSQMEGIKIIGTSEQKSSILSFTVDGAHPHDVATFLGQHNICIRAGHHCTQPIMKLYEVPATVRASFTIYNTKAEIDLLASALREVQNFFN